MCRHPANDLRYGDERDEAPKDGSKRTVKNEKLTFETIWGKHFLSLRDDGRWIEETNGDDSRKKVFEWHREKTEEEEDKAETAKSGWSLW